MVKKLKATSQRFSLAAKEARAAAKAARIAVKAAQLEQMLDQSIVFDGRLVASPEDLMRGWKAIYLDDGYIAVVTFKDADAHIKIAFDDDRHTEIEIRNLDACKSLLTYRNIILANTRPNGVADLTNLIRIQEAEAEADELRTAIGPSPVFIKKTRL